MPRLFKFAEENKAVSEHFVILTFHQGHGEKDLAACKEKFDNLKKDLWKIDKFPFPIVMDATGETLTKLKVRAFPTCMLIDPEGNLVSQNIGGGCDDLLALELDKIKKPKGAAKPSDEKGSTPKKP